MNTADISKLRTMTGAGMLDCKKALEEAGGDIEKAADILRKKGIVKAAKRADKTAAEGMVSAKVADGAAAMIEVNSETDFVAKNDEFKQLVDQLTDHILSNKPANVEAALGQDLSGKTVEEFINEASGRIGEKLSLRRLVVAEKADGEVFGSYIHMGGRIGVLVTLSGSNDEALARDIAMHVAAANPAHIDRDSIPAAEVEREKAVYVDQLKAEGKPENIIENIVKGKLNKFYEENCLVDQAFIKDDSKKVKDLLGEAKVKAAVRYELGEGIEKEEKSFADEVAEQVG